MHVISADVRGGGWYVMCAKSVAVTLLCAHWDFVLDERGVYHYLLQLL